MSDQKPGHIAQHDINYTEGRADLGEPTSTKDVASDEAKSVAQDAKSSASDVAGTAQQQAGEVLQETTDQIKTLFNQLKGELGGQSSGQQQRLASGLSSLADELHGMSKNSDQSGIASDLAQQAAGRAREAAKWMESREPGDVVEEVKRFARQRPGAFLATAALVGLVAGRMTRGIADEARDDSTDSPGQRGAGQNRYVAGQPQSHQPSGYSAVAGHTGQYGIGEQYAEAAQASPQHAEFVEGVPGYQPERYVEGVRVDQDQSYGNGPRRPEDQL